MQTIYYRCYSAKRYGSIARFLPIDAIVRSAMAQSQGLERSERFFPLSHARENTSDINSLNSQLNRNLTYYNLNHKSHNQMYWFVTFFNINIK